MSGFRGGGIEEGLPAAEEGGAVRRGGGHGLGVVEVFAADGEELAGFGDAADAVLE